MEDWKKAKVTPIFKKGKKKDPGKVMKTIYIENIARQFQINGNKVTGSI